MLGKDLSSEKLPERATGPSSWAALWRPWWDGAVVDYSQLHVPPSGTHAVSKPPVCLCSKTTLLLVRVKEQGRP